MATSADHQRFERAQKIIPGGVNSPVRSFSGVGGTPVFIKKASGAYVWDNQNKKYTDYVGSWGPAILGHAHPDVIAAVKNIADDGLSFGAPTELETSLAEQITIMMPSIEMVRLVSSGTEACMSAIRLARAFTKRDKFIKFSGCYHGHADFFLVQAGSGAATLGIPNSPGVPASFTQHTLTCGFNDVKAVTELFRKHGKDIASVILEPFVGNAGFIRPSDEFLQTLQSLCKNNDSLLIFDEVMTGFRVARGGAQEVLNIKPDLTTLGKVIGGGLPVGAYGGRKDIMSLMAPLGPVYQAGTLSGNPLAVTAGLKTLQILESASYEKLAEHSRKLMDGFVQAGKQYGIPMQSDFCGGMFGFFFADKPVRSFEDAKLASPIFKDFFHKMLERGFYLAPSAYEAGFVSFAHTDSDVSATVAAAHEVLREISHAK